MSKYNTDLDYTIVDIDISREELKEIRAEADRIISENKGNSKELAIAYLKKAQCLQKNEKLHDICFHIYDDYMKKQFEIKELLENALELSPDMPEALMRLGTTYNNIRHCGVHYHIDEAIDLINRAIRLKPDYAAALNNRSTMYNTNDKDNIIRAIDDLSEAIKLRPFDALYYINRGTLYSRLGEHKKAVEDFSKAINYASDINKANLINISVPDYGEEYKKTINDYSKSIDYDSDVIEYLNKIHFLRGVENIELKEYAKAIGDFSESLCIKDSDITLLLRGKAYYMAGEKKKAKEDFDEYKKRKHKDVDFAIHREFLHLIGDIDIGKEKIFFNDYIKTMSKEEYDKLPTFEELLKNLKTEKQDE
jgi:tetratricopeptide (TPR) repeat protein